MINSPAIVIVAFNRPNHLERLLGYIDNSIYPANQNIPLIISIDFQDSPENEQVVKLAESYKWHNGNKTILTQSKNLGLRSHILKCGDLTEMYGSIILLEDDLVVAPAFYQFALSASQFYKNDGEIAGVSLYSYEYEELGLFRFYPKYSGGDTFFMQWAASWGQLWTYKQWSRFMSWYAQNNNIENINISARVKNWGNSWKKYFIAYLVDTKRYFVYPYVSYTSLVDDIGTNIKSDAKINNVKLSGETNIKSIEFLEFSERAIKYDSFFQPIDKKCYISKLGRQEIVSFDFYGTKSLENITSNYVLTIKNSTSVIQKYSNTLLPYEMNLQNEEFGNIFNLTKKSDLSQNRGYFRNGFLFYSFRKKYSIKEMLNILFYKSLTKIRGLD